MRPQLFASLIALAVTATGVWGLGCASEPPGASVEATEALTATVPAVTHPKWPGRAGEFSAERAWEHLKALSDLGPRAIGSSGNEAARAYLVEHLEALGLEARSWDSPIRLRTGASEDGADAPPPPVAHQISIEIPGSQPSGAIMLAAPFDSREVRGGARTGANEGASGAAVLLEIARVLAKDPLPYTTEVFFLDGENGFITDENQVVSSVGTGILTAHLRERNDVHLLVYLDRVGDADLQIARNAMSHRMYRRDFGKAAERLDRGDAFPDDVALHLGSARERQLSTGRVMRVVWIRDESYGGDEAPGLHDEVEQDLEHCSAESLETTGAVTLEALGAISKRLVKIDRFAKWPTPSGDATERPEPDAKDTSETPDTSATTEATPPAPEGGE